MMRALNGVLIGVAIVLVWLLFKSPATAPAETAGAASADAPAQPAAGPDWSRLALHIEAYSAGPAENLIIVARLFDRTARQAEAIRSATGGEWKGSFGKESLAPVNAPAAWAERLQISQNAVEFIPIYERSMTSDDRARLVLRPLIGGSTIRAVLVLEAMTIESNEVTIEPATAPGLETLIARGRIAEVLERWNDLAAVSDEITRDHDASPWGHYYRGVVERARRNPDLARAAFQRALDRVEPGQEPPIGLVEAIK